MTPYPTFKETLEGLLTTLKNAYVDKLEVATQCEEFDEAGKHAWDVGYSDAIAEIEELYLVETGISPPLHTEWDERGKQFVPIYSALQQAAN